MRFPLRAKFFIFATLVACTPLALVGYNLAEIARDELKSAANEELANVAADLRMEFDSAFRGRWFAPLMVIRGGVDSDKLDVRQKIALLTLGLAQIPDVVALQVTVDGSDLPILVTDDAYAAELVTAELDPAEVLRTPADIIQQIRTTGRYGRPILRKVDETGSWLATLALPLETTIGGRQLTLSAQIDLAPLASFVRDHPFSQRGEISVIDAEGITVLEAQPRLLIHRGIVASATDLIGGRASADALEAYVRRDGRAMLGAYAFTDSVDWAVITELSEESAYAVVNQMIRNILSVGMIGFGVAALAALLFAARLSGPIIRIGEAAKRVGAGDLSVRVSGIRSGDEIGDLARQIDAMILHLKERLELLKFVSRGTRSAVSAADAAGVSLGGERRSTAILFSDIRGFTAFAERVAPEVVVEMLNHFFDSQTTIIERHGGDVDKFIGDEVVAVFMGADMTRRAVACGLEIQRGVAALRDDNPAWNLHLGIGIAAGEVVVGAVGARERMDFTVLGSTVNLASRLCDLAPPGVVLVSESAWVQLKEDQALDFRSFARIPLKGYATPIPVFEVGERIDAADVA